MLRMVSFSVALGMVGAGAVERQVTEVHGAPALAAMTMQKNKHSVKSLRIFFFHSVSASVHSFWIEYVNFKIKVF